MKQQKTKLEDLLSKIGKKLKLAEKDPDVLGYNYYNDKNFVGAKIMRNKKITLDELAAKFDKFADVVMTKLDRLEDFASKQLAFNELLLSLPTIKKEIEDSKKKK